MGWWRPSHWLRGRWAARTTERVAVRVAELGSLLSGPRPEFRAGLRENLLRTHGTERVPAATPPAKRPEIRPRSIFVRLRPFGIFGVLLGLMFAAGIQTYHSVPGDPLYSLKRAAEWTLLTLSPNDDDLARREMEAARIRATEAAALLGHPTPDRGLVEQALDDMDSTTRAALSRVKPRPKPDKGVRRFAREQHNLVEPLLPKMDRENRDRASEYLDYVDTFTRGRH